MGTGGWGLGTGGWGLGLDSQPLEPTPADCVRRGMPAAWFTPGTAVPGRFNLQFVCNMQSAMFHLPLLLHLPLQTKKAPRTIKASGLLSFVDCVKRLQTTSDPATFGAKIKPAVGGVKRSHTIFIGRPAGRTASNTRIVASRRPKVKGRNRKNLAERYCRVPLDRRVLAERTSACPTACSTAFFAAAISCCG